MKPLENRRKMSQILLLLFVQLVWVVHTFPHSRIKRMVHDDNIAVLDLPILATDVIAPLLTTTPLPNMCYFREKRISDLEKYPRTKLTEVSTNCGTTLTT